MSTAAVVRLQDVADINPPLGVIPSADEAVSFLPMAAVDADHMDAVDTQTRPFREVSKGYTPFRSNDVLVAKITPCFENGKIAQARPTHRVGFGSTEFHVVRSHVGELDPRYLAHFLRQGWIRVAGQRRMTGSAGQRRVPEHFLANLQIPLPPLAEQRRIAAILDQADALRAKRRAAIQKLDELTQAIFLDMFGDPAANPKKWPVLTIGDVARVQGGLQVTCKRERLPLAVPYLRVANVYRGSLDLREIKKMRVTEAEFARTLLQNDDLLIVEGHGNPAEIGRGALWDGSIAGCIHQNHLIRARFNRTTVAPHYASAYINSPGGRRHLLRAGKTTSGLNTISVSDVRATPIAIPNIDLQQMFVDTIAKIRIAKETFRASQRNVDALFASLQQRAFRGEL